LYLGVLSGSIDPKHPIDKIRMPVLSIGLAGNSEPAPSNDFLDYVFSPNFVEGANDKAACRFADLRKQMGH
jgi:hypothetical protein